MRPFLISLLLLSFLLYHAKGIRLEKGFVQVGHQKLNEEKSSVIKPSNGGYGCKERHCTGLHRKLTTVTTSISNISTTSSKNEENEGKKANPISNGRSSNGEVDIMDYSPARRKPPIHN